MSFIKRLFKRKKKRINYDIGDWIYRSIERNTQKLNTIIRDNDRLIDLHDDKDVQYLPISGQLYYKDENSKNIIIGIWNAGHNIQIFESRE